MEKKKKNSTSKIITIILLVVAVIALFYFANLGSSGVEIAPSKFYELLKVSEDDAENRVYITDIYAVGGTAKIRVSSSAIKDSEFPNNADLYFEYTYNFENYIQLIEEYNNRIYLAKHGTAEQKTAFETANPGVKLDLYKDLETITWKNPTASTPIIQQIMPYISIVLFVVLGFFLFKLLSGAKGGNAAGGFGKSKARLERTNIKFADIAGADEEKAETQEIVEFLRNPAKFKAVGARIPKGVLLVGPPGTGKTLLAKAVAGESNVPFFSISGSDFVELYVGVGASRVRDLFDTAKRNAPCIIFIDEIDAVGRQRGAGLGGGNDEREQTLNQLLVEMDGFLSNEGIIVLAATNRADVLDPALLRPGRFDRQITVNVPDVKGREGIMKIHARNKPIDKDVDFKSIARLTSGFTGADIENFLNEAAILAARDNRVTITMEDISEGIHKVLLGPQKKSRIITEKDKLITAYHESGHAIVSKLLKSGDTVHEVSIIPRGHAGGFTSFRSENDDQFMTYEKLKAKICADMGGRCAEEIIFKDITTGASADIVQATNIAKRMVTEWGMSKTLGFVNYGSDREVFIGRDYQTTKTYSESKASEIDKEIKDILDECYSRTLKCLEENKDALENMAKLLIEKETIYTEEVDMVLNGENYKDIIKKIDKREKAKQRKEARKRKEAELQQAKRMQELKEQAAKALNKAGVLSEEELKLIQSENRFEEPKTKKQTSSTPKKEEVSEEKPETSIEKEETEDNTTNEENK